MRIGLSGHGVQLPGGALHRQEDGSISYICGQLAFESVHKIVHAERRREGLYFCDHLWADAALDAAREGQPVFVERSDSFLSNTTETVLCHECAARRKSEQEERSPRLLPSYFFGRVAREFGVTEDEIHEDCAERGSNWINVDDVRRLSDRKLQS